MSLRSHTSAAIIAAPGGSIVLAAAPVENVSNGAFTAGSPLPNPVFIPAAVDERPHLLAHADHVRPFTHVALGLELGRGVDPDLPSHKLAGGRVVEVVERPLREQDVARRVDVGPDLPHHLAVVVHVDPVVDDDNAL